MIPADMIELLRCPQTGQTLALCEPALVAEINGRITRTGGSSVRNLAGNVVTDPASAGLIRADGGAFYPVRDRIPVLLMDQAIRLPLG